MKPPDRGAAKTPAAGAVVAASQFRAAMVAAGIPPPPRIEADGKRHRFPTNDQPDDLAGWYVLFAEGIPAGEFGDFRSDCRHRWRAELERDLTPAERNENARRMRAIATERELELEQRRTLARKRAREIWNNAQPAPPDHPYLRSKGVEPHGLRVDRHSLVVPIRDAKGELHSLQYIRQDGQKRFLTGGGKQGCFFLLGHDRAQIPDPVLCVAEGFATAASIFQATGWPTAVAFDAGNLEPVARALRDRYPSSRIVVCGDDDHQTKGNPGRTKSKAAARAVGGAVALPDFGPGREDSDTDFNDLHRARGLEAVLAAVREAKDLTEAPKRNDRLRVLAGEGGRSGDATNPVSATEMRTGIEALERLTATAKTDRKGLAARVAKVLWDPRLCKALGVVRANAPAQWQAGMLMLPVELRRRIEKAVPAQSSGQSQRTAPESPYREESQGIIWDKIGKNGELAEVQLSNFHARIVGDVTHDDGSETRQHFEVEGVLHGKVHRFEVPASRFNCMNWTTESMGAEAIIAPGLGTRDRLRHAVQTLSGRVPRRTVYTHSGWRQVGSTWLYLHGGGAIGANGVADGVEVCLPSPLGPMVLPPPPDGDALRVALRASLGLLDVAPDRITVPLLASVFRAVVEPADFTVFLAGPTGQGKSELAALAQQHFGAGFDARHLPGSFTSTGNSLEALAFFTKDALLVVDDFAPGGSIHDVTRSHREAERLLRAQGNRSGRARLNSDAVLRPVRAPRGLTLATGEDVPRGQSLRARLLVLELGPGDLDLPSLTPFQKLSADGVYAGALAGYVRDLAAHYEAARRKLRKRAIELRDAAFGRAGHARVPSLVGQLGAAFQMFLEFASQVGAIDADETDALWRRVSVALHEAATAQAAHLESADPIERFQSLLVSALSSGEAHVASAEGREPAKPELPETWGWRARETGSVAFRDEQWQPQGKRIGWLHGDYGLLLDPGASYKVAQSMAAGDALGISERMLHKRLHERGHLLSVDNRRGRLRVRKTVEGRRQILLHVSREYLRGPNATGPAQSSPPDHSMSCGVPQESSGSQLECDFAPDGPVQGRERPGETSGIPTSSDEVGRLGQFCAEERSTRSDESINAPCGGPVDEATPAAPPDEVTQERARTEHAGPEADPPGEWEEP